MKKKWNILAYILAVVLIVGGLLALWLPNRNTEGREPGETVANRPDTDPDAPFVDLSDEEKEKVLEAVTEYYVAHYPEGYTQLFWHGGYPHRNGDKPTEELLCYTGGIRYYGTYNGYDIVISPLNGFTLTSGRIIIADYSFEYRYAFLLFAYKDGVAVPLGKVYNDDLLSDEQLGKIYQCYERYNQEIYTRKAWEEHEGKN